MRTFFRTAGCLAITTISAMALDSAAVNQLQQTAQRLERDAITVQQALKSKKHDVTAVKAKIELMTADVGALDQLVKQIDDTNPQLSARDQAEWVKTRQLIHIITALHESKERAATEDLAKNRGLVRDYAAGVALRAKLLQGALMQLQRSPVS